MLHFDHGFVTFLYVPIYLVGDVCAQIVAILLVYVSILACCSALCTFEKHMLAFVDLIHALPTMGRNVPNSCPGGVLHQGKKNGRNAFVQGELAVLHQGKKTGRNAFVQGELAFMHLGALFRLNFSCALLLCRALLLHLEESAILEHFILVVSRCCPCLRGPRFFSLK
jgi:hypothetical protein